MASKNGFAPLSENFFNKRKQDKKKGRNNNKKPKIDHKKEDLRTDSNNKFNKVENDLTFSMNDNGRSKGGKLKVSPETPKNKTPTLSKNIRSLKFMSRKRKKVNIDASEKWKTEKTIFNATKSPLLVCKPLKHSITYITTSSTSQSGRKSFGNFNAKLEELEKKTKEIMYLDKTAVSGEEMAEFKMKQMSRNR